MTAPRDDQHGPQSREVGVGPHPEPWPEDPRLDPRLLAEGDRRNVEDRFRYWRREAIVEAISGNDALREQWHRTWEILRR